jgi:hypothetical protein
VKNDRRNTPILLFYAVIQTNLTEFKAYTLYLRKEQSRNRTHGNQDVGLGVV